MSQEKARDFNPNRLNIYVCETCGGHIVTRDIDQGTTPFMMQCRCSSDCNGTMVSSMYRVFDPEGKMKHTYEWYAPKIFEVSWSPQMRDHVNKGGLLLRLAATHKHIRRGSSYRIVGAARLQTEAKFVHGWHGPLDNDMLILYVSDNGDYSVRAPQEFHDGRFETVS